MRITKARREQIHRLAAALAEIVYLRVVAHKIPENVLQEDSNLFMWYDQALTKMGEV